MHRRECTYVDTREHVCALACMCVCVFVLSRGSPGLGVLIPTMATAACMHCDAGSAMGFEALGFEASGFGF